MDNTALRFFSRLQAKAFFTLLLSSFTLAGCAVDQASLDRWQKTEEGPRRLSSVVLFDKYPIDMRVRAALALIEMKPRKGQRVGLDRVVHGTLVCDPSFVAAGGSEEPCRRVQLTAETRAAVLKRLVPIIIKELEKPAPKPGQGGKSLPDPSFKYKDAAYMMMTYEKQEIITDQALKSELKKALTKWAMADFERKLNDRSQAYGMEQLLRLIGPTSVEGLPKLMDKEDRTLGKTASLVAKLGTKKTKEEAGKKLVKIMTYVTSDKWRTDKKPGLEEANRKAKIKPTKKQFNAQMADYQKEAITRVFASMKKVGGPTVVDYCLNIAKNEKQATKRRQVALAAIEGHLDNKNKGHIDTLLGIAKSGAPNVVLDQAFRRIRELPRGKTAPQLYELFKTDKWKLRRAAAATILAMSTVKHTDEFLDKLSRLARKNFNLPEAITYGSLLGSLKEGDPKKALSKHMGSGNVRARMAALSYYFENAKKGDLKELQRFERTGVRAPKCDNDAGCDWTCVVTEGKKQSTKEIRTVGHFVKYCVAPQAKLAIEKSEKKKKKKKKKSADSKKADGKKTDGKKTDGKKTDDQKGQKKGK